jgi:hypothetical protein
MMQLKFVALTGFGGSETKQKSNIIICCSILTVTDETKAESISLIQ